MRFATTLAVFTKIGKISFAGSEMAIYSASVLENEALP
jgi:hypothetical protein